MKTNKVATGILGALAMAGALGLGGCSAETGNGSESAIGTTSEALSVAAGATVSTSVLAPGSCVLNDGTDSYVMQLGGFAATGGGSPITEIWALKNGTSWLRAKDNQMVPQNVDLDVARGNIKAIQFPNDASKCLIVGGSTTLSGNALAVAGASRVVEILSVTHVANADPAFAITSLSGGNAIAQLERTGHELRACPSTNIILAFGGTDSSGSPTNTIASFDTSSPTTAWATAGTMTNVRSEFGLAQDGNNFVAVGGKNATGLNADVDIIKSTDSCASFSKQNYTGVGNPGTLAAVKQLAVIPNGTHVFSIAGGHTATAVKDYVVDATVNWTALTASFADGSALTVKTYLPSYKQATATSTTGVILGGYNDSDRTFGTNGAEETSEWTVTDLAESNGRVYGAVEYLPSTSKFYYFAGMKNPSGTPALLTSIDVVTP